MANYLVTGGCGFIGSSIVRELDRCGHNVRVFDNLSTGSRKNLEGLSNVELVEGDLTNSVEVSAAVKDTDFILHQAALPSVQRSVMDPILSNLINVTGTVNLLKAAVDHGVKRVVYAASSSAYGDQPVEVKTETLLPMPKSPYAVTKLTGEYYLQAFTDCYGLETVSLRYFNVFGARQDPASEYSAVIPLFITRCLLGERPTIYGNGTQSRDFTYVDNNVSANILASTVEGAAGVYNIACGQAYTLLELLAAINGILGTSVEPIFKPARAGDVKHSLADISRAKSELGYKVEVGFDEGLQKTVEWYRDNTMG